eukprot:gene16786-22613_t
MPTPRDAAAASAAGPNAEREGSAMERQEDGALAGQHFAARRLAQ